ncbi:MAG: alpha/beta hydrolase [Deltaproteobacteria bacterium]|nr:alpha/beta hydrolase [Deltaproteobacteria bacterium]
MDTKGLFEPGHGNKALMVFVICLIVMVGAVVVASLIQTDFGRVAVTNVWYSNFNGIPVRAKLLVPAKASPDRRVPGVVYIHGYQNNRETGDAYCIELAKRGVAVLNIDAIGRGNSGIPNNPKDPDFDETYGGLTSLTYLRALPFVNPESIGMMGHSLGAEMAYTVALADPAVKALVITGFAYTMDATLTRPKNMLMILGRWDEFRKRMTGTRYFEAEWMGTPQTIRAFPVKNPEFGKTYGEFSKGTARRVFVPRSIHIQESHSHAAIAEALMWMKHALHPSSMYWLDPGRQTWQIKEWATLIAMLSCFASLLPLGLMLLRTRFFSPLQGPASGSYACSGKTYFTYVGINGLLMWLFLPLILVLFAVHIYLVPIDAAFPMMMVNGIVWWFFWINIIGFLIFRRWFRKWAGDKGLTLMDLGVSYREDRFALNGALIGKTILLAAILFAFAYLSEHVLERIFIVDFRFIFPFASDLTPYRALLCLVYFPFILVGFVLMGIFLHGQLRRARKRTWFRTFAGWSFTNTFALIAPLILFLMVQYVPLFTTGCIPLVGPGGMFVSFVINLFHIIGVLIMTTPISTWFYQLTGKIYLGALVNASLVTWMFVSSQVIAPIPV